MQFNEECGQTIQESESPTHIDCPFDENVDEEENNERYL